MNKDALGFLGLAFRARALITGTELVLGSMRGQKVHFVLIAGDVSTGTLKKVTDKCRTYGVQYLQVASDVDLGKAIGKDSRKVIGITDVNFAKTLKKKLGIKN